MSVPEIRPALLTAETAARLDEFRAFRHLFHNVYGFNLSAKHLQELVKEFPETASRLEKEVKDFIISMKDILPEKPLA